MPQITIRVDGNVKVGKGMAALGEAIPDIADEELEAGLEAAAKEARGGWPEGSVRGYNVPLTRNGEKNYRRTGLLGRTTTWERVGRSYRITSSAVNARGVAYSKYVIGDGSGEGQAAIHAGRWRSCTKLR